MRIGTNIIVSALHDPVRLAEDATAVALLTGDRFELGYHEREFSARMADGVITGSERVRYADKVVPEVTRRLSVEKSAQPV